MDEEIDVRDEEFKGIYKNKIKDNIIYTIFNDNERFKKLYYITYVND